MSNEDEDNIPFASEDKIEKFKSAMAQRDDMRKLQEIERKAIDKALAPHLLMKTLLVTLFISSLPLVVFKFRYLNNETVDSAAYFIFIGTFLFISLINLKLVTPYLLILFKNIMRGPSPIERMLWIFMALLATAAVTIIWLLPIVAISGRYKPYVIF